MKISGLGIHNKIEKYLKHKNLNTRDEYLGLPIFEFEGTYFLGGYKAFYSILEGVKKEEIDNVLKLLSKSYKNIKCNFSTEKNLYNGKLANFVLDLNGLKNNEERFNVYNKKTRNQVRKSYKNDLVVKIGRHEEGFNELYKKSMKRLGGSIKNISWFSELEDVFGNDVVCIYIFDNNILIGCNYCLRNNDYISLLFNVSDQNYWNYNVNDRLYDELIKWSIDNNIRMLDFGPAVLKDKSHNHFKKGFGASEWYVIEKQISSPLNKIKNFIKTKKHNTSLRLKKYGKRI